MKPIPFLLLVLLIVLTVGGATWYIMHHSTTSPPLPMNGETEEVPAVLANPPPVQAPPPVTPPIPTLDQLEQQLDEYQKVLPQLTKQVQQMQIDIIVLQGAIYREKQIKGMLPKKVGKSDAKQVEKEKVEKE